MENKRVIIVANATWNIYKFRLNVIERLIEAHNTVYVVAPLDEYILYKEKFPDVIHIALKNMQRDHSHPIKDFMTIWELRRLYKKVKPDVIIHYTHKANIYGGLAAYFTKIKTIAVVTGLGYAFLHKGWVNRTTRLLYKIIKPIHKKVVFENEDDMNLFIDLNLVDSQKATFVNGCGVDTNTYLPSEAIEQPGKAVFTFIGRLLYDKGINEFVDAARQIVERHKNVEFWVIGELDAGNPSMVKKSSLLNWIEEGLINYLGFVEDVKPLIAQSTCIVLPSYREGMPRIILEGLSMAKPVITTNVAGCRQTVIEKENGFLIEPKSSEALIGAIESFLSLSFEEQKNMGKKGREMAIKYFNSEKISKELYQIISQVYFCG